MSGDHGERPRGGTGTRAGGREFPPLPDPLPVPVYDNHTHLDIADPSTGSGRSGEEPLSADEQLDRAEAVGVRGVMQVGVDLASSRWGAELASWPRVRAIGETGLDYFRTEGDDALAAQRRSFEDHIAIAREYGLALQIHDRDAHADLAPMLDRVGSPDRVVLHCFSADAEFAQVAAERGWYLSFAGTVTFTNAPRLREALRVIPRSRILVETDAPFLTPTPYRGRPNSAYLVPITVRAMAAELEVDLADFCQTVAATTERVYGSWDDVA